MVKKLRVFEERYDKSQADRLERASNEVATAGLFVPDAAGGPSNLRLPHKQYYEYILATTAKNICAKNSGSGVTEFLGPNFKSASVQQFD